MSCYNSTVPSSSPLNVMITSVDPASLEVSWQPPLEINHNGPITGYVIQYTRVGSSDMKSENVNSGTTHTISGLVAYVDYSVIVAAVNVNGTGPFSNPVVGRSGEDGESNKQHTCMSQGFTRLSPLFICVNMSILAALLERSLCTSVIKLM